MLFAGMDGILGTHKAPHPPLHAKRREAAASEWKLIFGTHNLLKLYRRALGDASAAPYSRMASVPAC